MMVKKQMARLVPLGILVAMLLLPAAWGGGNVLGYTDNYTDNITDNVSISLPLGGIGCGCGEVECGCRSCLSEPTAQISYTMSAAPVSPSGPSALTPLAVNVRTLPVNTRDLTGLSFEGAGSGAGGVGVSGGGGIGFR